MVTGQKTGPVHNAAIRFKKGRNLPLSEGRTDESHQQQAGESSIINRQVREEQH